MSRAASETKARPVATGSENDVDRLLSGFDLPEEFAALLAKACGLPSGVCALCVMAGGYNKKYLNSVEIWDALHQRWCLLPPMTTTRCGGGAAWLPSNRLVVLGGMRSDGETKSCTESSVEVLSAAHPTQWKRLAPMSVPRIHPLTFVVHGKLVVLCGSVCEPGIGAFAEEYDEAADKWTPLELKSLPGPTRALTHACVDAEAGVMHLHCQPDAVARYSFLQREWLQPLGGLPFSTQPDYNRHMLLQSGRLWVFDAVSTSGTDIAVSPRLLSAAVPALSETKAKWEPVELPEAITKAEYHIVAFSEHELLFAAGSLYQLSEVDDAWLLDTQRLGWTHAPQCGRGVRRFNVAYPRP